MSFYDVGAYHSSPVLGKRPFKPSFDVPSGKVLYVSPTGTGTAATIGSPCSLTTVHTLTAPGDRVVLRGGTYQFPLGGWDVNISGNPFLPIIWEPYVGETAIIDGTGVTIIPGTSYWDVNADYNVFRGIEIANMPGQGMRIIGNHNIFYGGYVHHCHLSGIHIQNPADNTLSVPTAQSNNIIIDTELAYNSDVGFTGSGMGDGENADGLTATQGFNNKFINLWLHHNSDDGMDIWKTTNTEVLYCISNNNGLPPNGDGNGFKLGAGSHTGYAKIKHCLAYNNVNRDFDANGGGGITMKYNTAYGAPVAFNPFTNTLLEKNISGTATMTTSTGTHINNNWQLPDAVEFISTTPGTAGFLVPKRGAYV